LADNEIVVVVSQRDRTNPAAVRAKWRKTGQDIEDDSRGSGDRAGKGFVAKFRDGLSSGDSKSLASGLIGKFQSFMMAAIKPTALSLATGFSAQFTAAVASGLASGAVKMTQGLGAVVALLPAIATAAGLALGTMKLAMVGIGDALKAGLSGDTEKFNEALKGLAPAAQDVMRSVAALKPRLDGLKNTVQGNFFAPLTGAVRPLADRYLPMIERTMGGIASQFGKVGAKTAQFLLLPSVSRKLGGAMDNMRRAVGNVTDGLDELVVAFLPLISVGSSFLPGLTAGFDGVTGRIAAFMTQAERTGKLRDFISDGLSAIGELIETAKQLGRIFANVAAIASMAFGKVTLSGGGLLDKLEKLTEKAKAFFETAEGDQILTQVMDAARGVAESFLGTLQKLVEMIAPFLPDIAEFVEAFNNLKTAILDAIEPALPVMAELLNLLTDLMNWMSRNPAVIQGILVGLFTAWAIHAAVAAAATVAATWPLILLGLAVAGLAYLVITHFATIERIVKGVYNWIKTNWPMIGGILSNPVGWAVGMIFGNLNRIIDFVRKLPGRIAAASAGMWGGLIAGLAPAINWAMGRINAMVSALNSLTGRLAGGGRKGQVAGAGAVSFGGSFRPRAHGGIGGGLLRVAERGRELLQLPSGQGVLVGAPQGTRVHPNGATESMLAGGGGGGPVFNFYVQGSLWQTRELVGEIRDELVRGGFGGLAG
jgi:hypothetical protein